MTRVTLPHTDLHVATVCLGAGEIGSSLDQDASFRLLDAYVEAGGNFLDTAHCYGDWIPGIPRSISERTIGAWMKARGCRDEIVLATKGAHWHFDCPDVPRLQPEDITQDLTESLDYLQTDRIDLYWLHRDDPKTPVEAILDTLHAHQQAGRIYHYGASNWQVGRLRDAQQYAEKQDYTGFVADQILWNPAVIATYPYGDFTVGFMDESRFIHHEQTGMACLAFQSQAFGLFHRIANGTLEQMNAGFRGLYRMPETLRRYERLEVVRQQAGLNLTQAVLGWLRGQLFVTVPIVGCRNHAQLADSMTALDAVLTPEQVRFITWG